jgi:hypothetical protein
MFLQLRPEQGIKGYQALREAKAGDYRDILTLVNGALAKSLGREWIDLVALYATYAVVQRDGRHYAYQYTLNDANQIEIGGFTEVVREYTPVGVTQLTEAWGNQSIFIESVGAEGSSFLITVIEAGLSYNNTNYSADVLREAVKLFEGARVFNKSDAEHIKGEGKSFNNLIGQLTKPRFIDGAGTKKLGAIQATFNVLKTAGDVSAKLVEAVQRDMLELFGFSIDCDGTAKKKGAFREATSILRVNSVDLIIEPGAGGRVIRMVEAKQPIEGKTMTLLQRMIEAITKNKPALLAGLDQEDESAVLVAFQEATASAAPYGVTKEQLDQTVRMVEARSYARATVAASKLPQPAIERLTEQFSQLDKFTEAQVDAAIKAERDYLAKFTESGKVRMPEGGPMYGDAPNAAELLAAFFDPKDKAVRSFRECYIDITGDRHVTGDLSKCSKTRMVEALNSASLPEVLGEAIHKKMIEEYSAQDQYDIWREIAKTVPVTDFRNQERVRYGGYGDLPVVAESGSYNALTSPSDESANYKVSKRGGTEKVTLELIKNDDVGVIMEIPRKLARAGKRTLSKFVLDFLRNNAVIYDSKALAHVDHGNLLTAALDATSWKAARLAMMKQVEYGVTDPTGIPPRMLLVPADLETAAHDLFVRNTNLDETLIQTQKPKILVPWYWTDANDWVAMASPLDIPTIEIGFLDGNEEPELFVQDNPTVGSLFTNDEITYKIRHIYGGVVKDFRGVVKSVVPA